MSLQGLIIICMKMYVNGTNFSRKNINDETLFTHSLSKQINNHFQKVKENYK